MNKQGEPSDGSDYKEDFQYYPGSLAERIYGIVFCCAGIDGEVSQIEVDQMIIPLLIKIPFLVTPFENFQERVHEAFSILGSKGLIDACIEGLDKEYKECILSIAMDIIYADGVVKEMEKIVIRYVSNQLEISQETFQQIEQVIAWKNKGNVTIEN